MRSSLPGSLALMLELREKSGTPRSRSKPLQDRSATLGVFFLRDQAVGPEAAKQLQPVLDLLVAAVGGRRGGAGGDGPVSPRRQIRGIEHPPIGTLLGEARRFCLRLPHALPTLHPPPPRPRPPP